MCKEGEVQYGIVRYLVAGSWGSTLHEAAEVRGQVLLHHQRDVLALPAHTPTTHGQHQTYSMQEGVTPRRKTGVDAAGARSPTPCGQWKVALGVEPAARHQRMRLPTCR